MWNMTKLLEELGRNYFIPGLLPSWIFDIIISYSFCLFDVLPLFNNAVYFMNPPFRKRKVREIEEKNRPADNEKWKNKGKMSYKRAKQRRL